MGGPLGGVTVEPELAWTRPDGTSLIIREATRKDYPGIARLMRFTHSLPATEENLVESDARRKPGTIFKRYVAVDRGEVVAYCKCERWPVHQPVRFIIAVAVEPDYRHEGLGAELYRLAEKVGLNDEAEQLWAQTLEQDIESEAFLERRGYKINFFLRSLTIVLKDFDASAFENVLSEVKATGIRFVPFSEFEDSEENRRRLYDVHATVERDVPNLGEDHFEPFDDWQRRTFHSPWYDAAGQILAIDGDRWVGIGAVGQFAHGIHLNMITGVLREYRGRKIGMALKLLGIEFAKSKGGVEIQTQNHDNNAAMLAINAKFGYKPMPGWNFWHRLIKQPSNVE
jgi:GNAT superfamily N-acetyltransferase